MHGAFLDRLLGRQSDQRGRFMMQIKRVKAQKVQNLARFPRVHPRQTDYQWMYNQIAQMRKDHHAGKCTLNHCRETRVSLKTDLVNFAQHEKPGFDAAVPMEESQPHQLRHAKQTIPPFLANLSKSCIVHGATVRLRAAHFRHKVHHRSQQRRLGRKDRGLHSFAESRNDSKSSQSSRGKTVEHGLR